MIFEMILTKQEGEKLERILMYCSREHPLEKVRKQANYFLDVLQTKLVELALKQEQLTLDEK